MFDGFAWRTIRTSGASINLRVGGSGPPVLLVHGYPQSHVMWHAVAPLLAEHFTVVTPDLRGYGDSSKPASIGGSAYSKRVMAQDLVEVMSALGFEQFALAGHDRGGRVAYRLAFDHPGRVTRLATLDITPTHATFAPMDFRGALGAFHWFLLAQPAPLPEQLIGAAPLAWLHHLLARWAAPGFVFDPAALAEYERTFSDPEVIRATCEDYRAGPTIDFDLDAADLAAGRKITCPLLAMWGERPVAPGRRTGVIETWANWATDIRAAPIPSGHFLAEEAPAETAAAVLAFFSGA
ncbi:MAG: alpha/beta fold hydrolase [Tepidiformaceae bacterium]